MTARILNQLRLIGTGGANKVMAGEASRLARRAFDDFRVPVPRGEGSSLVYPFDTRFAGLLLHYHRTSARLLWDLYESDAQRLEQLYTDLYASLTADTTGWWRSRVACSSQADAAPEDCDKAESAATVSVYAQHVGDFPAGERQIVGTVKNAIVEACRAEHGMELRVDPKQFDYCVSVRGLPGKLVVSLDLAGQPMHQRGYRLRPGGAPLREDLAALVVMLSRFDVRTEALIDPMAGAGTLAIEGHGLAHGAPTWHAARRPLAENWSTLDASLARRGTLFEGATPAIWANERDPDVFGCLQVNSQTAEVDLTTSLGDFRELEPERLQAWVRASGKQAGVIVCNPPYGERTSGKREQLARLYRDFGNWCRQFPGWRAAVLVANPDFVEHFGGKPRITKPLSNGPLRGYFHCYDL